MFEEFLKDGERLDDLQLNNNFIISHKDKYCFTSDSVMLANLVKCNAKSKIVDLCCGQGIIGILIALKNKCKQILGVELQEDMADMASRSVALNGIDDKMKIINYDAKKITDIIECGSQDIVVCNPPYYKTTDGATRSNQSVAMARHEISITLADIVQNVAKILKFGGTFYLIHKAERLGEVFAELAKNNLTPKNLYTICPQNSDTADTFIVVSKLGAKSGLTIKNIKHI